MPELELRNGTSETCLAESSSSQLSLQKADRRFNLGRRSVGSTFRGGSALSRPKDRPMEINPRRGNSVLVPLTSAFLTFFPSFPAV